MGEGVVPLAPEYRKQADLRQQASNCVSRETVSGYELEGEIGPSAASANLGGRLFERFAAGYKQPQLGRPRKQRFT